MVRIVGGKFKGSRLTVPAGQSIRPTSDRSREAIFNILSHGLGFKFDGITVLDLFSGTGALGFEALSRGANRVVFIDNRYSSIESIKSNGRSIRQSPFFSIRQTDASCLPARTSRDEAAALAFLDPPYRKKLITPSLLALDKGGWLRMGAVVVEMAKTDHYKLPPLFSLTSERKYGKSKFTLLSYGMISQ